MNKVDKNEETAHPVHPVKKVQDGLTTRSALRPLQNQAKFSIYADPVSKAQPKKSVNKSFVSVAVNTDDFSEGNKKSFRSVHVQTTISHSEYESSSASFLLNRVDFECVAQERLERINQLEELNASLDMQNTELQLDKSDLEEKLASKEAENEELRGAVQSAQALIDAIKPIMDDNEDGEIGDDNEKC